MLGPLFFVNAKCRYPRENHYDKKTVVIKLRSTQVVPLGAGITFDYGLLFFGANSELCERPFSECHKKVLETPALRTEPITLPNQDMLSPVMLYNPFLCCIA